MNTPFKIFLSMSFSGGLLILLLFFGKRFWKDKISRQWQYYIWLVVILRLLLPFGPETNLMGKTYRAVEQTVTRTAPYPVSQKPFPAPEDVPAPSADPGQDVLQIVENSDSPTQDPTVSRPFQNIATPLADHIWLIWFTIAFGLLIRKITIYRSYIRYIRAGMVPVSDIGILDRLSVSAEKAGVKRPIELCVNPSVSSPLLIGSFRPCIVLPGTDISEKDFQYTILHELTHYRRYDMFYKWLVQVTICLHWFNPLVHLMSREIAKACEFSCDEAVLAEMGYDNAQDYGKTLLDAMAAAGQYRKSPGALTLSENKQLLKERLSAIMKLKERSRSARILTAVLTLCVVLGAAFIGIYSVASANRSDMADDLPTMETLDFKGTTYYLVQNEAQLRAIATGGYGMDKNYMQQADISLSAEEWIPIGTKENPFTGTFNGNGFTISGLTMTDPDAKLVGLFGVAENAHIYNITLLDLDIESAGRNAVNKSAGAIAAIVRGRDGRGSRIYDNTVYPKETVRQRNEDNTSQAERYYESGSLPLFEIAFSELDEDAQRTWLEKLYADNDISFFSAAVSELYPGFPLPDGFAEKLYADEKISFFSVLTDCLSEAELELWLERALEDGNPAFQSMLYDALGRSDELNKLEKEWEEAQMAEYQAVGVTMNGKNYFYQEQPVHIFLDIVRIDGSLYTLHMNPAGTVNIKILRDDKNAITGVAYMSEEEVTELLEDMDVSD